MGRLTVGLALPAHSLFLYHRHPRRVHFHIQDGNRGSHHHREIQLYGALDLLLLALGDVSSEGLRGALHCLRGHVQAGQEFHLLAAVIEGRVGTHSRQHASHAGRQRRALHVPFGIRGKLPFVTVGTQIIRALQFHLSDRGENPLAAQLHIVGRMTARAGLPTLRRISRWVIA